MKVDASTVLSALVAGVAVIALAVVAIRTSNRPVDVRVTCEVRP